MTDLHTRISVRAYFMAEAAGWPEGQREGHWFAAEALEKLAEGVERAEATFMPSLRGPVTSSADVHDLPPGHRPQHIEHVFAFHETLRAKAAKRRAAALKGAVTRKANRDAAAVMPAVQRRRAAPENHATH